MNQLHPSTAETILESITTTLATDYQKVWINEGPVRVSPALYENMIALHGRRSVEGYYEPYPKIDLGVPKQRAAKHVQPPHRITSPRGCA